MSPPAADAHGPAGPDEDVVTRLRMAIGRLNRRVRVDSAHARPPLQATVLVTLGMHAPMRLSELARREAVTPPTMSRVLASLDEADLLVRRRDPHDARSALVELSERGHAAIAELRAEGTAVLARTMDRLPAHHRSALVDALPALEALAALPDDPALPDHPALPDDSDG